MSRTGSENYEVKYRPAQPYAAVAARVTMAEMAKILPPLSDRVADWLDARGVDPAGPPFWRYRVIDMAALMAIDVGFPIRSLDAVRPTGPTEQAGREEPPVECGELPAGRYVTVRHTGHPDTLIRATGDLLAWAGGQGLHFDHHRESDGDHWDCRLEIYLSDPDTEPDLSAWVTELAFRLAD